MHRWECKHCKKDVANGKGVIILHSAEVRKYYADQEQWSKDHPSDGGFQVITGTELLSMPHRPVWYPTHWECTDGDHSYEIAVERLRTDKHIISWFCHFSGKTSPTFRDFGELVRAKTRYYS